MLIIIFRKSFKIFREKLILQILLFCVFSQFWEIAFFSFFLFSPSLSLSHTPLSIRYNSIVLTLSLSLTHSLSLCTILHKKFCLSCLNILIASCFFCVMTGEIFRQNKPLLFVFQSKQSHCPWLNFLPPKTESVWSNWLTQCQYFHFPLCGT